MAMFRRVAGKATKVSKQEAEEMVRKARADRERHADAVLNDEVEYEQSKSDAKSKNKSV